MNEKIAEEGTYAYVEQIKELISSDLWGNLLLDCSKNEILVLWFLYRQHEVNMTQIAEYIHVPLNTATGIVARMEKKKLLVRVRSEQDKRVVIIRLEEKGSEQIQKIMKEVFFYIHSVLDKFDETEIAVLMKLGKVLLEVMEERKQQDTQKNSKVRKITIG